jgi:hypothetical protein
MTRLARRRHDGKPTLYHLVIPNTGPKLKVPAESYRDLARIGALKAADAPNQEDPGYMVGIRRTNHRGRVVFVRSHQELCRQLGHLPQSGESTFELCRLEGGLPKLDPATLVRLSERYLKIGTSMNMGSPRPNP